MTQTPYYLVHISMLVSEVKFLNSMPLFLRTSCGRSAAIVSSRLTSCAFTSWAASTMHCARGRASSTVGRRAEDVCQLPSNIMDSKAKIRVPLESSESRIRGLPGILTGARVTGGMQARVACRFLDVHWSFLAFFANLVAASFSPARPP